MWQIVEAPGKDAHDGVGERCHVPGGPVVKLPHEPARAMVCIRRAGHPPRHRCFQGESAVDRVWYEWD